MGDFVDGMLAAMKYRALQQENKKTKLELAEWEAQKGSRDLLTQLALQKEQAQLESMQANKSLAEAQTERLRTETGITKELGPTTVESAKLGVKGEQQKLDLATALFNPTVDAAKAKVGEIKAGTRLTNAQVESAKTRDKLAETGMLLESLKVGADLGKGLFNQAERQGFAENLGTALGGSENGVLSKSGKLIAKNGTLYNSIFKSAIESSAQQQMRETQLADRQIKMHEARSLIEEAQNLGQLISGSVNPEAVMSLMAESPLGQRPSFQLVKSIADSGGFFQRAPRAEQETALEKGMGGIVGEKIGILMTQRSNLVNDTSMPPAKRVAEVQKLDNQIADLRSQAGATPTAKSSRPSGSDKAVKTKIQEPTKGFFKNLIQRYGGVSGIEKMSGELLGRLKSAPSTSAFFKDVTPDEWEKFIQTELGKYN